MKVKLTFHEEVLGQKLPDHQMELKEMWYERDEGRASCIAFTDIEGYTYVYSVDYIRTMLVEE